MLTTARENSSSIRSKTEARCDSFGSGVYSFGIEFATIGDAGNAPDSKGTPEIAGSVPYDYRIGKYEISRVIVEKANAAAGLGITLSDMSSYGGNGPNQPAAGVGWVEAARFVNWLNTNAGYSAAYKFDAGGFTIWQSSDVGFDPNNQFRNAFAHYFLPSSDEWYKAAYYDPAGKHYFKYPTGSDSVPTPTLGGSAPGTAVYIGSNPNSEDYQQLVGPAEITQAGGLSPFGTMGQGGNMLEWEETDYYFLNDSTLYGHGVRGGYWNSIEYDLKSTYRDGANFDFESPIIGFRVASVVPESSTILTTRITAILFAIQRRRNVRV